MKKLSTMRSVLFVIFLGVISSSAFGQAGNFRTLGSGPWGTAGTWERDADLNGSFEQSPSLVSPTSTSGTITIRNTHTVNVAASVSVDQTTIQSGGLLIVDPTFILTLANGTGTEIIVDAGGVFTINGTLAFGGIPNRTVVVSGDLSNSGAITGVTSLKLSFLAGANYNHQFADAGTIPSASWNSNSTVNIVGYTSGNSTPPGGLNQTFGHFVWNSPGQDVTVNLGGLPATTNGDFSIIDTGADVLYYSLGGSGTTLNIGGNLNAVGGVFGFTSGDSGPSTLNVTGDIDIIDGYVQFANDQNLTVNIDGDFLLSSSGQVDFSATSAITDFNLQGDFSQTGGSLFTTGGVFNLNFVGSSVQTYTSTLSAVGTINYSVGASSTLSIPGANFIGGTSATSTFLMNGNLQVGSTHASGAIQTGASNGSIRINGTRTYANNSTIVYNGSAAQVIGNGHPSSTIVNTTIDNVSGASLNGDRQISGVLTLLNGNLSIGAGQRLTLDDDIIANTNFIVVTTTSDLTINGGSITGTFPFQAGSRTIRNFTLDRSGGSLTFANPVTITGATTLISGDIIFNSQSLTLNGTFAAGAGFLSCNSSSSLTVGGIGAFGSLRIHPTNNTIGTFTFNRSSSGTGSVNSTLVVSTAFNLSNGDFTNTSGLQVGNNATLTRNSNSQLLGNAPTDLPSGQSYSVTYTGSNITTGLELPTTTTDMLRNLTINGGPVTLNKNIQVNGNVDLQNSTFDANGFNITMASTSGIWNKGAGSFSGGTGSLTIAGSANITITASSTPNFSNITANSGFTLTFPSGNINISGNLQLNTTGTFNANGGTVILNGGSGQTISAANKTFRNLTVNKTGGGVTLSTAMNLTGLLDIQTATAVGSNGNLTLISNGSGTASIGDLSAGGSVTGNVNVQRFIAGVGRFYRDISPQVLNPTVAQIISSGITITGPFTGTSFPCTECSTNGSSMYFYDETVSGVQTNGYIAHPPNGGNSATSTLSQGRGYNLLIRNTLGSPTMSLSGTINSGTLSLPVTFTASAGAAEDGWNFIGNPYPSTVDWDIIAGWSKTNYSSNAISVWDPLKGTSGGYRTWNGSTGDLNNGRIASGQGFWIHAVSGTAISVNEAGKTTAAGTFYRKESTPLDYLEIALKDTQSADEDYAYLQINRKANLNYDDYDAAKLKSPTFNLTTLSMDGIPLSINLTEEIPIDIPVNIRITEVGSGTYTLNANSFGSFSNVSITLHDRLTGEVADITTESYSFTIAQSATQQSSDRFYVVFNEGVNDPLSAKDYIYIYPNPVEKYLNVLVSDLSVGHVAHVLDIFGRDVSTIHLKEENQSLKGSLDMSGMPAGIYMMKISKGNSISIKKFIKN